MDKNNINRIRKLQGKKKGRCFIVATGPSLVKEDVELLENEITFGVNSIFLMYDKTKWRPQYYVCTDSGYFKKVSEEYKLKMKDLSINEKFLNMDSSSIADIIQATEDTLYIPFTPWNRMYDFKRYRAQDKIYRGMYAFGTVTNIAIMIAIYMGYKKIYLIGADCSNLNRHFVNDVTDNSKDDKYVDEVVRAQLLGYEKMKIEASKRNAEIYNATRGGALEVFPRVELESVLASKEGNR